MNIKYVIGAAVVVGLVALATKKKKFTRPTPVNLLLNLNAPEAQEDPNATDNTFTHSMGRIQKRADWNGYR